MRRQFLMFMCVMLAVAWTGAAGELKFIENGRSEMRIVVPDNCSDPQLERFLLTGAEALQQSLLRVTGAKLHVVREKELKPGQRAIYIGDTATLRRAGVAPEKFQRWEHLILVRDGNIYLAGNDVKNLYKTSWPKHYGNFVLGSLKAVTLFLERFGNTRFLAPGADGIAVLPTKTLTIPDNFSLRQTPQIEYCIGRGQSMLYDIANNFLPGPWYGNYGGHSHNVAIPPKLYAEHPEYFVMRDGKRSQPHPIRPQYCLSNPQVRELIYAELLRHLDQGYSIVQLGQSDGFGRCQCPECAKSGSSNAELWAMHIDMAKRLSKDRPGKMLCIMAYGPTLKAPDKIREFPANVIVELAPYNEEVLADWKKMKVPGGFVVYLYNWGWYQQEGFTPKCTADFLTKQLKSFHAANVRGVYRCGFGELFGLEGASYYQWGRQLADPGLSAATLRREYCQYAFGKSAEDMTKFYDLLDSRLKLQLTQKSNDDWNNPALLNGSQPNMADNMLLLHMRYPAEVLDELDLLLRRAEQKAPDAVLLKNVRREFNYLALTARAVNACEKYRRTKASADGTAMFKLLLERDRFIDALPRMPGAKPPRPAIVKEFRMFGYPTLDELRDNGRLSAPLRYPLNADAAWMLENNLLPAGRVMRFNSAPQLLVQLDFYRQHPEIKEKPVRVEVKDSKEALKVIFHFENTTQQAVANDQIQVYFGRGKERLWLPGRARNGRCTSYVREKTNAENGGRGDVYRTLNKAVAEITAPAPGVNGVSAQISLPWSLLGGRPAKGEKVDFNVSCQSSSVSRIWEHNLYQQTWRNMRDECGKLEF